MKYLFKRISGLLGLLLFLLILPACQLEEQVLFFETIAQREVINYRVEESALLVIAKANEVGKLVGNVLAEDSALAAQLRDLDYDRFFAVLVLQGQQGSTGYSVTVQQVRRQRNQVIIKAKFVEPAPTSLVGWLVTSPFHLIAIPKQGTWGQPIRFVLMTDTNVVAETTHFVP